MEKVNGERLRGQIVINMRVNIIWIRSTDKESLLGHQAIILRGRTHKMKEKDMERCIGQMEVNIKGIGEMEFSMDMVEWYSLMEL